MDINYINLESVGMIFSYDGAIELSGTDKNGNSLYEQKLKDGSLRVFNSRYIIEIYYLSKEPHSGEF